jgi:hypothetical protein
MNILYVTATVYHVYYIMKVHVGYPGVAVKLLTDNNMSIVKVTMFVYMLHEDTESNM